MLTRKTEEKTAVDERIEHLSELMSSMEVDSEEYAKAVKALETLYKIKRDESPTRVDANTKAIIAGNLAGIALILNYERLHVVSSKALGFIIKSKV